MKYNIKTQTSELVGDDFVHYYGKWISSAVADDGCFYYFPYCRNWILNFNPKDDTIIFVGEEIICPFKFSGTIKAKHGYLYGIPSCTNRVAKFNVDTQDFTFIGDEYKGEGEWMGGVEGMDDNTYGVLCQHNKWLKIDIATEMTSLVGDDLSKYGDGKYIVVVLSMKIVMCTLFQPMRIK